MNNVKTKAFLKNVGITGTFILVVGSGFFTSCSSEKTPEEQAIEQAVEVKKQQETIQQQAKINVNASGEVETQLYDKADSLPDAHNDFYNFIEREAKNRMVVVHYFDPAPPIQPLKSDTAKWYGVPERVSLKNGSREAAEEYLKAMCVKSGYDVLILQVNGKANPHMTSFLNNYEAFEEYGSAVQIFRMSKDGQLLAREIPVLSKRQAVDASGSEFKDLHIPYEDFRLIIRGLGEEVESLNNHPNKQGTPALTGI